MFVDRVPQEFARYWRRVRGRTLAVAGCIPSDRMDWSPGQGAMTIGYSPRHLAMTERWLFVEIARGRQSGYVSHGPELGRSTSEVLDY